MKGAYVLAGRCRASQHFAEKLVRYRYCVRCVHGRKFGCGRADGLIAEGLFRYHIDRLSQANVSAGGADTQLNRSGLQHPLLCAVIENAK